MLVIFSQNWKALAECNLRKICIILKTSVWYLAVWPKANWCGKRLKNELFRSKHSFVIKKYTNTNFQNFTVDLTSLGSNQNCGGIPLLYSDSSKEFEIIVKCLTNIWREHWSSLPKIHEIFINPWKTPNTCDFCYLSLSLFCQKKKFLNSTASDQIWWNKFAQKDKLHGNMVTFEFEFEFKTTTTKILNNLIFMGAKQICPAYSFPQRKKFIIKFNFISYGKVISWTVIEEKIS